MKHKRIPKSNRHKKLKSVNNYNDEPKDNFRGDNRNLDDQAQLPRKWTQILDLKNKIKQSSKKKKKKKNDLIRVTTDSEPIEKGMTRSDKSLPQVIEQGLYESEAHFMSRLNKLSAKAKAEATIEDHFDVDFCQKLSTTEDIDGDNEKTNTDDNSNKNMSKKNLKNKLRKINKKAKKRSKSGKNNEFSHLSDQIGFGERVDEPPVLGHLTKKLKKK